MLENINKYLCGIIMPILLILVGIFFIFKLKFFYILHPIRTMKSMSKGGLKSLSLALAGTLGVGNIVGVASAIIAGGAGAVFWMWISATIAMSVKYVEVILAMKHRRATTEGSYYGGAPYYINEGFKPILGNKVSEALAIAFATLCVFNSLSTGNLVQVNSVVSLIPISKILFGIIFAVLALLIILKGIKGISAFTSFLIPILSVFYVGISLYIIIINIEMIPNVLHLIIKEAFSYKSVVSGFMGYGIMSAIRFGISRGLLSNEAGCGTSPTAHASSCSKDFHSQGCLGIFEVFVDTILLCSLTAFVILISNTTLYSPMELVIASFEKYAGPIGKYGIIISSLLFAFATIACQYYYGIESLCFISSKRAIRLIYTIIFVLVIIIGAIMPMSLMWQISDLIIALMTIINLVCILFLFKN